MKKTIALRLGKMTFVAFVGAAALGIGFTAQRVYASEPTCVDYACTGDYRCVEVNCVLCHTDKRCAL